MFRNDYLYDPIVSNMPITSIKYSVRRSCRLLGALVSGTWHEYFANHIRAAAFRVTSRENPPHVEWEWHFPPVIVSFHCSLLFILIPSVPRHYRHYLAAIRWLVMFFTFCQSVICHLASAEKRLSLYSLIEGKFSRYQHTLVV